MVKLNNKSGHTYSFPQVGITAPSGEFDCPDKLVETLLKSDAIIRVGSDIKSKTKTITRKLDKEEEENGS